MLRNFRIKGLCAAPVTPFKRNGDLNLPMIKECVQHFVDFGVPNAFVNGTTGEGNNMTVHERKQAGEAWVNEGKQKLQAVVIQIGANNLRESQSLAEHAESIGADAITCVGTVYYKPQTMKDYVNYMAEVAASAPKLPFLLYDIDFMTGIKYDLPTFFELAKPRIPNLAGAKQTSMNYVSTFNTHMDHRDMQLIMGTDEMIIQSLAIGVKDIIMNTYNGHVLNRLIEAFQKGNMEAAKQEQKRTHAIDKIRKKHELSAPGGSKAILNLLGLNVGQPRCPLSPVTEDTMMKLKKDLEEIGFFDWAVKK